MTDTKKEEEALNQLQVEQGWLLDKIDELRTIGVGGLVELPQLIVCGNQSSGKSSVLEAISRVRFPMKSNLCTRFATEVSLRRHPNTRFKVTIEPGPSRKSDSDREKVKGFTQTTFTNVDQLPELIEQAKECMGISGDVGFSDDILKLEISGPDKPELTLVDLPGLYYSTSASQGQQGIQIVRNLTERYMKNTRSVILAVLSAKADLHVQEVLNIAEKFDRTRERTIAIVTQPDALEAHSEEEESWLQNIQNQNVRLQLGWHALRNRSFESRDASDDERDRQEKEFFNQGKWNSIARDSLGIDSLRRRLSGILLKHIRNNLPGLIADINEKVLDRQSKLKKLGAPRSTLQQQKGFLLGLSSSFERITGQALDGMYTDDFFGGLEFKWSVSPDSRRLRAVIRDLNEYFAEGMEVMGCENTILDVNGKVCTLPFTHPYSKFRKPDCKSRFEIEAEIDHQARRNRGIELPGSPNQLVVGSLFRNQAKPWEDLARHHLIKAWEAVSAFVGQVLDHLADEHTYQALVTKLLGPELDKLQQQLLAKLDELTAYNKRGHPLPLSKSFLARIQKTRSDRIALRLSAVLQSESTPEKIKEATKNLESSSDQFAAADVVDQMQAYYESAMTTFIDNVATLAIENCLLAPLGGIFTCQTINDMDDNQVRNLAAEPSFVTEERDRLTRDLDRLQAGLRALSQFNVPKATILPVRPIMKPHQSPAPTPTGDQYSDRPIKRPSRASRTTKATSSNGTSPAPVSSSLFAAAPTSPSSKVQASSPAGSSVFSQSVKSTRAPELAPSTTTSVPSASTPLFGAPPPTSSANKSQASTPATALPLTKPNPFASLMSAPSSDRSSSGSGFGGTSSSTSSFGKPSGGLFGPSNASPGFGQSIQSNPAGSAPGGLFAKPNLGGGFGGGSSTGYDPKSPFSSTSIDEGPLNLLIERDGSSNRHNHYKHISYASKFKDVSQEEIRLTDYRELGRLNGW